MQRQFVAWRWPWRASARTVKAAIMGVVEGLTEFLPISSTGHLILAGALLGFEGEKAKVFDIAIQTGAIFAVILVYWQKIRSTVVELPTSAHARRFALNVFIGFLPAVVQHLAALVDGLDVASGAELRVALDTGTKAADISFAGPGKSDADLSMAVAAGVIINAESEAELLRIAALVGRGTINAPNVIVGDITRPTRTQIL